MSIQSVTRKEFTSTSRTSTHLASRSCQIDYDFKLPKLYENELKILNLQLNW